MRTRNAHPKRWLSLGIAAKTCDNSKVALTASKAAGHVPQGRPGLDHNPTKDM